MVSSREELGSFRESFFPQGDLGGSSGSHSPKGLRPGPRNMVERCGGNGGERVYSHGICSVPSLGMTRRTVSLVV